MYIVKSAESLWTLLAIIVLGFAPSSFASKQTATCEAAHVHLLVRDPLAIKINRESIAQLPRMKHDLYGPLLSTSMYDLLTFKFEDVYPQRNIQRTDLNSRILVDGEYEEQVHWRRRILNERDGIYKSLMDTTVAEFEVLELVVQSLLRQLPGRYRLEGEILIYRDQDGREQRWNVIHPIERPLRLAGQLVQEDLIIVKPGEVISPPDAPKPVYDHEMVAGFLAFPSNWRLQNHIGNNMASIHKKVPSKPSFVSMINRVLSNLGPGDVVMRNNWFINLDFSQAQAKGRSLPDYPQESSKWNGLNVFLRVERQTMSLLPKSGYKLFTIKAFTYPLEYARSLPGLAPKIRHGLQLNEAYSNEYADEHEFDPLYVWALEYLK